MPFSDILGRGTSPSYPSGAQGLNPLLPDDVAEEIIQGAIHKSVTLSMFRKVRMASNVYRMPVISTLPTAYFVSGDTGLKQTTSMAWQNVFLTAEEIAVIVPISENVLDDVSYNVWDLVRPRVEEAIAITLDAAIMFGVNKPASWPSDITTAAVAAGNSVTQGTSAVDYADDLNNVLAAVEGDGYQPDGWIFRQDMQGLLRALRATTKEFIFLPNDPGAENTVFRGSLLGLPSTVALSGVFEQQTGANKIKAIAGDFDQGVIGIRSDINMKMLDQAVLQDANGDIQYNLAQQDMVAMRLTARFAWAVPNPINRIQTVDANRYPFGVFRHNT